MSAARTQNNPSLWKRVEQTMGWNLTSYLLMLTLLCVGVFVIFVWWPIADLYIAYIRYLYEIGELWQNIDWLLIAIWLVMTLLLMRHANLRHDLPIIVVCLFGGLVIEGWGTQTEIWTYFTQERPPLWIIPAWPVAGLSIDRLVQFIEPHALRGHQRWYRAIYWIVFPIFFVLMWRFVDHTLDKSLTIAALFATAFLILTPRDYRFTLLTFAAGVGLGFFLETWGTTRLCWTYYTKATPPIFAVLAHGLAAVAFWRVTTVVLLILPKLGVTWFKPRVPQSFAVDFSK